MTWIDYSVRLFILIVFAMTCIVSGIRSVRSEDPRVVWGAVLLSAFTGVGVYTQIPMRSTPVSTVDWLRVALCVLCLAYLWRLHRGGLN